MRVVQRSVGLQALRAVACGAALLWMGIGAAQAAGAESNAGPSAALSARYALLKDGLGHNQFNRPLHSNRARGKAASAEKYSRWSVTRSPPPAPR
jgi:hypothetical protein